MLSVELSDLDIAARTKIIKSSQVRILICVINSDRNTPGTKGRQNERYEGTKGRRDDGTSKPKSMEKLGTSYRVTKAPCRKVQQDEWPYVHRCKLVMSKNKCMSLRNGQDIM